MAAGALVARGIMRSSRNARISITPTPAKSTFRRFPSTTSNPSGQKRRIPSRKTITKSQSENVLASQFRTLSLTPNRQPANERARSATPKKTRPRALSTITTKNIVDIAKLIKEGQCRNIIIMAGAGISTPSGIPDFRTPGTGLYDNLQEYNIPEPTAIFDIEYFWYDPRPFFCLAKELYPGNYQPNYVHYFIKLLHDKGLLFRMYTQNIDGLERLVGIPSDKLVEAHGTFSSASCIRCHKVYDGDDIEKIILKGDIPKCQSSKCKGVIKPDIVFFGEDLPKRFYSFEDDFPKCDLLIVMGTSLEVEPFAGIVSEVSRSTPRLLINREAVGPFASPWKGRRNDVTLKGDVVSGIKRLVKLLEWNDEMFQIVTEGNENWKNKKELEMKEKEEEIKSKKNEKPSHKPNGNTTARGFHTMAGNSTQDSRQNSFLPSTLSQSKRKSDSETLSNSKQNISLPSKTVPRNGPSLPGNGTSLPGNGTSLPGHRVISNPSAKQTLFTCNSVARRTPLLPFRYTHRPAVETLGNFKTINPKSDLASAGFGRRESKGAKFYVESSSDSSDSSSSDSEG